MVPFLRQIVGNPLSIYSIARTSVARAPGARSQEVTLIHRTGTLQVGDDILLIVVSAGHRRIAFAGCEYILERIKERAPIWKREIPGCGDRWVKGNTE